MKEFSKNNIRLDGRKIYLRPLTPEDASSKYAEWLCDKEVNRFLETKSATILDVRTYIEERQNDPYTLFLGIFLRETDGHLGTVKIRYVDLFDVGLSKETPEIGIMVGEKSFWGKGIGREAMEITLDYWFRTLGFDYMTLGVIVDNERAVNSYHKAGFKDWHLRKKWVCYGGVWYDHVTMVLRREDFNIIRTTN